MMIMVIMMIMLMAVMMPMVTHRLRRDPVVCHQAVLITVNVEVLVGMRVLPWKRVIAPSPRAMKLAMPGEPVEQRRLHAKHCLMTPLPHLSPEACSLIATHRHV